MARESIFSKRLSRHYEELKWLYMELYNNDAMYAELESTLRYFYEQRSAALKKLDKAREASPDWYKSNDMLGMMLYIDNFAGNIRGVADKLDYLEEAGVSYIHLMPFLDTTDGKSDGGYAVRDFRKVKEKLGTMEDLEKLTATCHKRGMSICMDFVMNHTCEDHDWAVRARQGDGEYMSRYFFYDSYDIPSQFEKTVPQVFPTTAPGNFTYLSDCGHYVMTSFYPYQWDLNYRNPRVFNEMIYNFLYLANRGIDIIRIDAVPYIWKTLGTNCRNLKEVHTIVRMMRMVAEIVCPAVILLGEVVMEPSKVVPYFGTVEKPECHMLYNVTTMATTWHSIAARDVRLLKRQLDIVNGLPKDYVFLNYLRCHDDIGWGLDFETLSVYGMKEREHKNYLNAFFQGFSGGSVSRGELYNYDPVTEDGRFCGTTASMCGIEKALYEGDGMALDRAVQENVMLHAYMFMQSGIPVIYSGDEVAQLNDYTYKEDPLKREDSRYIHRGAFNWQEAASRHDDKTAAGRVFTRLQQLESLRKSEKAFMTTADAWTIETGDQAILGIGRYYDGDKIYGIFNFSDQDKVLHLNGIEPCPEDRQGRNMLTGETISLEEAALLPYDFILVKVRG